MRTRQQTQKKILERGFTKVEQLLALDDYEFEQWCSKTAKGDITQAEEAFLCSHLALAERWVDGLEALIDSADTQIEHAEAELDGAEDRAERSNSDEDWRKFDELEAYQRDWKPKIRTFQRKVKKTLRKATHNLKRIERSSYGGEAQERIEQLEAAIYAHMMAVDEDGSDEDLELWSVISRLPDDGEA